jgi:hypothetical protein
VGCDTIGSICVGPKKFDPGVKNLAEDHLIILRELSAELAAKLEADENFDVEQAIEKNPKFHPVRRIVGSMMDGACPDYVDTIDELVTTLSPTVDGFLDNFMAAWDAEFRDTMVRDFPGDKDKQILVAAIQSWGDGPDRDSGTWLLWRAASLGLFEILGIE